MLSTKALESPILFQRKALNLAWTKLEAGAGVPVLLGFGALSAGLLRQGLSVCLAHRVRQGLLWDFFESGGLVP